MVALVAVCRALLVALFEVVLGFIAPPRCAACAVPTPPARPFCAACASTLLPLAREQAPAGSSRAPFAYGGALQIALCAYKYGGRPYLARPLGHLLRAFVRRERLVADVVVPVPLHPRRRAERGHDQSALLARHVARELGIPCHAAALERTSHGPAQASLSRAERLRGATLKFAAPRALTGQRVVLVDDVVTTGATTDACRAALLAAGAASVEVVALARTLAHDDA